MTIDGNTLRKVPTKYFQHFSELRNSEKENLPIRKRGPEAGKYLLICHPRLMANQYTPPFFNPSALRFNARETIALSEESRSRDVIFDFAHHPSLSR
ncbi:hypothetical protein CDAR_91461 [Caerostris darwini]|uniref:Uncharacterized protein n=1 Tax=Caerostris darwini TaxID=1538125 RepID=A0AAV4WDI2_9ARAC|nr:hypothetical protein CDAR_91461 [Caerostris darwini]